MQLSQWAHWWPKVNARTSSSIVLYLVFWDRVSHRIYSSLVQLAVLEVSGILLSLTLRRTYAKDLENVRI